MDENDRLLEALKPTIAMREDWFAYADNIPVIFGVEVSAQRIDYLLGATISGYESAIQKLENNSDIDLTEWHSRYKAPDSELISFYEPAMHFWKMNELISKLCFESKRTGQEIRPTLQIELMLKQLEMCRMMVNYSIEGDIWKRAFGAALSLIKLIDQDEDLDDDTDEDLAAKLTYLAESSCVRFWDEKLDDFSYPRFRDIKDGHNIMLTLLGVGIDVCLRAEGSIPFNSTEKPELVALYDFDSNEVVTIKHETVSGVYYRERGFWWNFGGGEEEYFDDFEMIYVKPEFVDHFDRMEFLGDKISTDEITRYALTYEELWRND
jgi:hypothetical protein